MDEESGSRNFVDRARCCRCGLWFGRLGERTTWTEYETTVSSPRTPDGFQCFAHVKGQACGLTFTADGVSLKEGTPVKVFTFDSFGVADREKNAEAPMYFVQAKGFPLGQFVFGGGN